MSNIESEVQPDTIANEPIWEEELFTCEFCGRVWDGNAQCFPCPGPEDDFNDTDFEESQEDEGIVLD